MRDAGSEADAGLPPGAPTGLTATPGNRQVSLDWNSSARAESYALARSTTAGGPYSTIRSDLTTTSHVDTGLTNGTTYYYVVTASNRDGESAPSKEQSAVPMDTTKSVLFVVGNPSGLNTSEEQIRDRLMGDDYELETVDDDGVSSSDASDKDLVIVSKTVQSTNVSNEFKEASCGVLFWEDNMQRTQHMALIDNDGSGGTAWHSTGSRWSIELDGDTPAALAAGLSGTVSVYTSSDEITYAPSGDLPTTARVVAGVDGSTGDKPYYVYEAGDTLADGTSAAGRRVYFGLYDDTFRLLTSDALAMFDAAVNWASGSI